MPLRLLALYCLLILGSIGSALLLAGYASTDVAGQPAPCTSLCGKGRSFPSLSAERAERFARVFRE